MQERRSWMPEKMKSRTSWGTSSLTTPRRSIAEAATDAAVVTAFLYDSMAFSYEAMEIFRSSMRRSISLVVVRFGADKNGCISAQKVLTAGGAQSGRPDLMEAQK
ncbi:hypothetical protein ACMD2_14975 [Ananas comosus]|uniref:Uncharacterized protein n=1 Tax=Ananas comosus TaxID=4615 RepID=A0A199VZR1_ANACO|nr:hypothetical protein ACMD2_14975 [Ananas comosus]